MKKWKRERPKFKPDPRGTKKLTITAKFAIVVAILLIIGYFLGLF